MNSTLSAQSWIDFINESRLLETGEALLYRNPVITVTDENSKDFSTHHYQFSLELGEEYLFDQKPIARGFTAYIAYDEVRPGHNSLKSNILAGRGFYTEDYYRNYSESCMIHFRRKNDTSPLPISRKQLDIEFYSRQIMSEIRLLRDSRGYYKTWKNDRERKLIPQLLKYSLSYLEWLRRKLVEIDPVTANSFSLDYRKILKDNGLKIEKTELLPTNDIGKLPVEEKLLASPGYIKGIHGLARFLGISTTKAQKMKNEGMIPCYQTGRTIFFDPEKVREAVAGIGIKKK